MATKNPQKNPLHSARLSFRTPESPSDDDFFTTMTSDIDAYMNANITNATIPGSKQAKKYQEYLTEKALLGVMICLRPNGNENEKATPIGAIHLNKPGDGMTHHRSTEIGIEILKEYQGKGYGSEAITWILGWAFQRLGLHRVQVRAFGWNVRAIELYKKLGFKEEGRWRDALWHNGQFWDDVQLSMLEDDWKQRL